METVVVTGGAGFIGSTLVRRLLERTNDRVVVFDALTYAGHVESLAEVAGSLRYAFVRGDVADRAAVDALYREHRPRAVLHLAAESHVDRSVDGPRPFLRTNVDGTLELLEGARKHLLGLDPAGRSTFRFLHVSTDEVYGPLGPTGRTAEDAAYAPRSPYAASKAAGDHLVEAWHATYGVPTLLTNGANNYGPRQFPEKLIPLTLLNALDGRPLPVYGDGKQVRDWIHVDDHVDGLLAVLERGRPGEKVHLGAHDERTNLETVTAVCDALEAERPAGENPGTRSKGVRRYRDLVTHVEDRPGHDRRYAVDASKAKRELGWSAKVSFGEGVRRTVRWYLENRAWCEAVEGKGAKRERLGLLPGKGAR